MHRVRMWQCLDMFLYILVNGNVILTYINLGLFDILDCLINWVATSIKVPWRTLVQFAHQQLYRDQLLDCHSIALVDFGRAFHGVWLNEDVH